MLRVSNTILVLALVACQPAAAPESETPADPLAGLEVGSTEWKIQAFSGAAPASIAANATVMDWNDSLTSQTVELRAGTNGWTCLPLAPPPEGGYTSAISAAPMCGDAMTMQWAQGYLSQSDPQNEVLGLAYMLHGDLGASNIDPYAMAETDDNDWVVSGPHLMMFPADPARIQALSTDYRTGGPYVMWKDTPYAHIMIPSAPDR